MDSSKAKKAKSTAEARKKQQQKQHDDTQVSGLAREQQMQVGSPTRITGNITPEVTAPQIALQTPTVNPYHMMGAMAPTYYNPGNVVGGGYNP